MVETHPAIVDEHMAMAVTPEHFRQALADAQLKASMLKDIVDKAHLSVNMGSKGGSYLMVEGWQTIGRAYGYTSRIDWSRPVEGGGWEAHASVIDAVGNVVGSAEAESGTEGDSPWDKRPSFQQRSMAQTRAISKSLRSILSWVVVLAGYEPTPQEEMPPDSNGAGSVTLPAPLSTHGGPTEKQINRLHAIRNSKSLTTDTVKEYMQSVLNVEQSADLNHEQYEQVCNWMEAQ